MRTPHLAMAMLAASALAQQGNAAIPSLQLKDVWQIEKPNFVGHKPHSRNKHSSLSQRQHRRNRRRAHAAGKKGVFA